MIRLIYQIDNMDGKHEIVNFCYNIQSVIHLVANLMIYSKVKHIKMKFHFIKNATCDIELIKIGDKFNSVDYIYFF